MEAKKKEKESTKSSAKWGEKLPEPPAMTEPLIEPKEQEIDRSTLLFLKFVFEPDRTKKKGGGKEHSQSI